jgi:hypothetical protein
MCDPKEATTLDIWNEHDQPKRRDLIEKYWAADVTCYSPFGIAIGYDALDHILLGGGGGGSVKPRAQIITDGRRTPC